MLNRKTKRIECSVVGGKINLTIPHRKPAATDRTGDCFAAVPQFLSADRVESIQDPSRGSEHHAIHNDRSDGRSDVSRSPSGLQRWRAVLIDHLQGNDGIAAGAEYPTRASQILPASESSGIEVNHV